MNKGKPKWCHSYHKDNKNKCCYCKRDVEIIYQEGDGENIHSLCKRCYDKLNSSLLGTMEHTK